MRAECGCTANIIIYINELLLWVPKLFHTDQCWPVQSVPLPPPEHKLLLLKLPAIPQHKAICLLMAMCMGNMFTCNYMATCRPFMALASSRNHRAGQSFSGSWGGNGASTSLEVPQKNMQQKSGTSALSFLPVHASRPSCGLSVHMLRNVRIVRIFFKSPLHQKQNKGKT